MIIGPNHELQIGCTFIFSLVFHNNLKSWTHFMVQYILNINDIHMIKNNRPIQAGNLSNYFRHFTSPQLKKS